MIDRRQSIEDFLLQGLGHDVEAPSPHKSSASVTVLSALDHHVEQESTASKLKDKEVTPSPATISEKSSDQAHRDGPSTNYWEQFNTVQATGGSSSQAVEAVPAQAVCCLCGSAGVDEMLFCSVCAEPSHPFCLDPTELPQSSEDEKTWVCHRCAACEICGESTDAADDAETQLRCSACCKMFHVDCLEPEQRREDEVPWVIQNETKPLLKHFKLNYDLASFRCASLVSKAPTRVMQANSNRAVPRAEAAWIPNAMATATTVFRQTASTLASKSRADI
jgi:hypothetical protein